MKISSIVLGCTHYPLIKDEISRIIGKEIPIIDGSLGTSKQLKRILSSKTILNTLILRVILKFIIHYSRKK